MTNNRDLDDQELEGLFAAARAEALTPSAALMGRILSDAETVQLPLWQRMSRAIGGWPAFAGLMVATVSGVWIGVAAPDMLGTVTGDLLSDGYDFSSFSSELTLILAEG